MYASHLVGARRHSTMGQEAPRGLLPREGGALPHNVLNYIDGHHSHNTFASIEYARSNAITLLHQTVHCRPLVTRPSTAVSLVTRPLTAVHSSPDRPLPSHSSPHRPLPSQSSPDRPIRHQTVHCRLTCYQTVHLHPTRHQTVLLITRPSTDVSLVT